MLISDLGKLPKLNISQNLVDLDEEIVKSELVGLRILRLCDLLSVFGNDGKDLSWDCFVKDVSFISCTSPAEVIKSPTLGSCPVQISLLFTDKLGLLVS